MSVLSDEEVEEITGYDKVWGKIGIKTVMVRQAEQATLDAVVKMIEEEHIKQLNTATEHNYYAVLANKLKENK